MTGLCKLLLVIFLASSIEANNTELSSNRCDGRIYGGQPVEISRIPFQVALTVGYQFLCGGSLISSRWILTAAHCVSEGLDYDKAKIRINSTYWGAFGRLVGLQSVIMHPKYTKLTQDYDFALIELNEEVALSKSFYAAELPNNDETFEEGTCLQVSGWGLTDNGIAEGLRVAYVPLVDRQQCRIQYRKIGAITKQMMCAGYPNGGTGSCHGDSGGPLIQGGRKLVGVVSFGGGCALRNLPGVYAKVFTVRRWIRFVSGI